MKAISLFSGVGGFEQGFDRAGIETVLQVEQDPHALSVLARHWPDTERLHDVRSVQRKSTGRSEIDTDRPAAHDRRREARTGLSSGVDLVYGGFPCQDVSVAGQRRGLAGDRSGLWFEFERILSELRPRWAVIENVPGLLSSNSGNDFRVILNGLCQLGYSVGWTVLDAQNFGVPQRRRRVFVIAGPGVASVRSVLSLCEGCGRNPAPGREARQEVAGTLGGGTHGTDDPDRATFVPIGIDGGETGYSLRANPSHSGDKGDGGVNTTLIASTLRGRESGAGVNMPGRGGEDDANLVEVAASLNARDAKGPLPSRGIGTAIPSNNGVRRLTPRECERLMGWPDDWTRWAADGTEIADSHRYRMCGNGVVSTVAEWIGRQIVDADRHL